MLEHFRTQYLIWDKAHSRIYKSVKASAGDSNGRKLHVQIVNDGADMTNATLSLAWKTKDEVHSGLDAFTLIDSEQGKYEIYYTTSMLSHAEVLSGSLVLVDSTGRIESDPFDIVVTKSNVNDETIQSENSFTALTDALVRVEVLEEEYKKESGIKREETLVALKASQLQSIKAGDIVLTSGYFASGDGGHGTYLIKETAEPEDGGSIISLAAGKQAHLLVDQSVNYKQFGAIGDGVNDDAIQMKAAHAYANSVGLPVINPSGEYWIKETRNIPVMTNHDLGQTVIHIDESSSPATDSQPFKIASDHEPFILASALHADVLPELKKGTEPLISELKAYRGHFMRVTDSTKEVYKRNGGSGQSQYDIFYIAEGGQLIGEVTWNWDNITEIELRKCDESYLTAEGGTFLFSGDLQAAVDADYKWTGFFINRSHTIVKNQYVGFPDGVEDDLTLTNAPARGFHYLEDVYDVTIDTIRNVPRKTNNHGSYGINGWRAINVVFRNITAEGGADHWGVVATNYFKNVFVDNCKLNRFDSHVRAWNLTIKDSRIGREGLMLGGGGTLRIENTAVYRRDFINMRADYGASWDGDIYVDDCKMVVLASWWDNTIISFTPGDYDYGFDTVFGRVIRISNFTFDFLDDAANTARTQIIEFDHPNTIATGRRLIYPSEIHAENIRCKGRETGVQLVILKKPTQYYVPKEGGWDSVNERLTTNALYTFKNIQLDDAIDQQKPETSASYWSQVYSGDTYTNSHSLYPKVIIENCSPLKINSTQSVVHFIIKDSVIRSVDSWEKGGSPARFECINCEFNPNINTVNGTAPYRFQNNDVALTGCMLYPIKINDTVDYAVTLADYVFFDTDASLSSVNANYNHAGTRLSKALASHLKGLNAGNADTLMQQLMAYTDQ